MSKTPIRDFLLKDFPGCSSLSCIVKTNETGNNGMCRCLERLSAHHKSMLACRIAQVDFVNLTNVKSSVNSNEH